MEKQRPFLKWAGGKYRCLDTIISSLPEGKRLIEPFAGSGVVFLNANYPAYLIADGNQDLVHLYQYVKQEGQTFINDCERLFCSNTNQAEAYYTLRKEFNVCKDTRQRALLFLYLNRHGYNGLCRYNLSGGYNVPFGQYKKPYFPRDELYQFYLKSQQTDIIKDDFRATFLRAEAGDVIYCDPPYVPLSKTSNFSSYTSHKFGEKEQIILADLAREASHKGITVVISNHDTPFTREHYKGSAIISFPVKRNISCHPQARPDVRELIAIFN